ncbi:hypothetical protein AYL99_01787 [Fonsecaea erecta]|uniref:BZIP domain-containing protein n=1 Tax=Fonsecaea erecta TaxID=1367422 RepID=A0A178ZRX3_9EURO|nr:hypothetical protein AYL99_01787 [Fonsecaea erecta]OAP62560.1 hypothetical protein AYL99_01787 [Fonsecaea erecta]
MDGLTDTETTYVHLEPDVVVRLDLRDQDTITRKRNRDAQRNHRELKRMAAAAAAAANRSAAGEKPKDTGSRTRWGHRKPTQQSTFEEGEHSSRPDEILDMTNPMFLGTTNKTLMDLDSVFDESWSSLSMMQPGLGEPAAQPNAIVSLAPQPDSSFNSFYNRCQTPDRQHANWGQGQNTMSTAPQAAHDTQYGHPPTLPDHAVKTADKIVEAGPHGSQDTHLGSSISEEKKSQQSSFDAKQPENQIQDGRFESILEAVESAGFYSFDEMAAAYYTSSLGNDSSLRATQKFSRERELKSLLRALNQSAKDWSAREAWAYQEETLDSARRILSDELSKLAEKRLSQVNPSAVESNNSSSSSSAPLSCSSSSSSSSSGSGENSYSLISENFERLLQDGKINQLLKQEIIMLRQTVPDAFDHLAKLAQNANISQPLNSRIVAVFLHLLIHRGR